MIITCPNCNKKFNIDVSLIPEKGRLLQCGSCNHKWHYIISKQESENDKNINIQNKDNKSIYINKLPQEEQEEKVNKIKEKKNSKIQEKIKNKNQELSISTKKNNKKYSLANLLGNLMIILITFVALILIIDTFKIKISNYFPLIIPLLDSLYQSLIDLISFVNDLLN